MIFKPEETLGYDAFLAPLIYGAVALIPIGFMYSSRELTLKEILIRKVLQFVSLEAILIWVVFGNIDMIVSNVSLVLSFALSVFVIFVLVHVITWVLDLEQAKQLTKELHSFQHREDME